MQRSLCDSSNQAPRNAQPVAVPIPQRLPHELLSPIPTHKLRLWPDPAQISLQLQKLYRDAFDRVFTGWINSVCNINCYSDDAEPTHSACEGWVSNSEDAGFFAICAKLDRELELNEQIPGEIAPECPMASRPSDEKETMDIAATAIYCFCVRWLPVLHPELLQAPLCVWHKNLVICLWRKARRLMLKAANLRSYRSMFSLILFGLTPVPTGVEEAEEIEGLSGSLCFQIALQHLYSLRSWCRTLKFSLSMVVGTDRNLMSHPPCNGISGTQYRPSLHFESMLYSAGIILDTSTSFTLDYKPVLGAGILGIDKELFFEIIKTRALIIHERWQKSLLLQASKVGDAEADEIIMSTGLWKLYFWKKAAVLKEGLRDGCSEDLIQVAFTAVLDAIERFRLTYSPMIDACMRRLDFLSFRHRFDCCKYMYISATSIKLSSFWL